MDHKEERRRLSDDAVLIVGAGLAGLFLALSLAPRRALVLSPTPLGEGAASAWAQGGLAAALGPEDAPALHAADTVAAGAGLVDPAVAALIASDGPDRVLDLLRLGVPFDRSPDGSLALSLEAAHSKPRVARVRGDLAGKAIMEALVAATRAADHIEVLEGPRLAALLQSSNGAIGGALCTLPDGRLLAIEARETVLATGGVGGLYRVTTNPPGAQGAALAAAVRAGIVIADQEFVQFHPTAIDIGRDPAPLATEALRGEGARLVDCDGRRFMLAVHPLAELAPRDVVARAIHAQVASGRGAFLDAAEIVGDHFPAMFPTVFAACMGAGLDPRRQPIPVAPAAHYHMGGVLTDIWAKTSSPGLSAIGECAATGAHGANRLASNSLLEAVVFAHRLAQRLREEPSAERGAVSAEAPPEAPPALLAELRERMGADVGVLREGRGLAETLGHIDATIARIGPASPFVAARCIAHAALLRTESRGAHCRADFPDLAPAPKRTFLENSP